MFIVADDSIHSSQVTGVIMRVRAQWVEKGIVLGAAAVLGVVAIVTPVALEPTMQVYDAPLFPLLRSAVEGLGFASILFLLVLGFLLGLIDKVPPILLGPATLALFPLAAVAEVLVDPTSHNLFPIECMLYVVLSIPATIGAFLGRWFRRETFGVHRV